jgi:alpha-L-fucosidase
MTYGEGPTEMPKAGCFMEDEEVQYTARDIRFTVKDDALYAICLGWPDERVVIETLKHAYEPEIKSIRLLGVDSDLEWSLTPEGLSITMPREKPCDHAFALKIVRGNPFEE